METGGYLSHGAIVAREYGIPAVLNVPLATQRIPDGCSILLDGAQGVVQVLHPT
jgi:pyruvate,water dikinase